jgi:L-asparaginase/Glu-tRNA(Gln) amidotransferase subunit D
MPARRVRLSGCPPVSLVRSFFHDRLLRACRATKVNTHRLMAFDSPNLPPLAQIGITIDENEHLQMPPGTHVAHGTPPLYPMGPHRLVHGEPYP